MKILRKPLVKVAVLYNVDYEGSSEDGDPGWAARADVAVVARAVAEALDDGAHEPTLVPVDGDLVALRARMQELSPDCVFNLCESLAGDARLESAVPLVFELLGIPCTGSSPEALSHALYKDRVKERLRAANVPTPGGALVRSSAEALAALADQLLPFPLMVKPVREDGSVGITSRSVVSDEKALAEIVDELVRLHAQPCLVERYIEGRELNVALVGFPTARVLPLCEMTFDALPPGVPRIVSYDAKWRTGSAEDLGTVPLVHPALPAALAARVRRVAVEAFRAVGLRDYGRIDIRLSSDGVPYVIDVNPNCDLSPGAGMARAAAAVGMEYAALVKLIVRYALRRRNKEAKEGRLHADAARARASRAPV
jgi:D-alanine-D-alanine ligase